MREVTRVIRQRTPAVLIALIGIGIGGTAAASDATSFVTPDNWTVGDDLSAYQEWDIFVSSFVNPPDVGYVTEPPIADPPTCSALPPGFLSSSGNFYAFSGDYTVEAEIFNHGSAAPDGYGTIVRVQTAATQNPDFGEGLILDSVRLAQLDDTPIPGGAGDERCRMELLFSGTIGSPFGDVVQDEWLFVYWLPDYTADFKVVMDCYVHSSFVALRVDTLNAAAPFCESPDVNCNCRIDPNDAARLLMNLAGPGVEMPPAGGDPAEFGRADLDLDGDVDLRDYAEFQTLFPY